MCGRYLVITEEEIIEMRAILDELGQRFGGIDEILLPAAQDTATPFPSGPRTFGSAAGPSQITLGDLSPADGRSPDLHPAPSGDPAPVPSREQGEVFPGTRTPVLVLDDSTAGTALLRPMRWGFSRWDGKGVIINARAETVSGKPMFSKALSRTRCIIPSRGFYEWRHSPVPSSSSLTQIRPEKYRILRKDSPLFLMAGIYQIRDGEEEFVILTMPAMDQMKDIHERMPVFTVQSQILRWLEDPGALEMLLANREKPYALERIKV